MCVYVCMAIYIAPYKNLAKVPGAFPKRSDEREMKQLREMGWTMRDYVWAAPATKTSVCMIGCIYVYVCIMYICMLVCMYVCMYVCIHVQACMHVI